MEREEEAEGEGRGQGGRGGEGEGIPTCMYSPGLVQTTQVPLTPAPMPGSPTVYTSPYRW